MTLDQDLLRQAEFATDGANTHEMANLAAIYRSAIESGEPDIAEMAEKHLRVAINQARQKSYA